ncbi:MAG: hypothetical protein ACLF0G_06620 [Candidatus Brocadiia bacterium]
MKEHRVRGTDRRKTAHALAAALLAAGVAAGDVVHTLGRRLEGRLAFRQGAVEVADQRVGWDDVVLVLRQDRRRTLPAPHVVRLTRGEAWAAEIRELSGEALHVHLSLVGDRELELADVAALEFRPHLSRRLELRSGTLYRQAGEPIPGSLLWMEPQRLAIDSPLGVLTIQREGLLAYRFDRRAERAEDEDEVRLLDGTVLRCKATPGDNRLELDHPVLGHLAVPADAVRWVVRAHPQVRHVAGPSAWRVRTFPLIVQPAPPPEPVALPGPQAPACLRGLRVEPRTVLRCTPPGGGGQPALFRARVAPLEGARGDAVLRLSAGGERLAEKTLGPDAGWERLRVELEGGKELTVEVDFGLRLRFPCGVVLGDPHFVSR